MEVCKGSKSQKAIIKEFLHPFQDLLVHPILLHSPHHLQLIDVSQQPLCEPCMHTTIHSSYPCSTFPYTFHDLQSQEQYSKNNLLTQLHTFTDCEPTIVTQALKNPKWRQTMSTEYDALVHNGTWKSHDNITHNVIACKWTFHIKHNPNDSIALMIQLTDSKLAWFQKAFNNN
jgi:hypothetical protein